MEREPYLTVEMIAELLNVHERTIRRIIREKKLAAYRVGKEYRVEPGDFETYKKSIKTVEHQEDKELLPI